MASELEWRRRWKPDLHGKSWKSLKIDDTSFFIKSKFSDDAYEILVSDLTSVWYEHLDGEAVKRRSKVSIGA